MWVSNRCTELEECPWLHGTPTLYRIFMVILTGIGNKLCLLAAGQRMWRMGRAQGFSPSLASFRQGNLGCSLFVYDFRLTD